MRRHVQDHADVGIHVNGRDLLRRHHDDGRVGAGPGACAAAGERILWGRLLGPVGDSDFSALAAQAETVLKQDPFGGHLFVFRGRRGDMVKLLWFDGDGLCLFAKRLERGRFVWPQTSTGAVSLSNAQLSMLLEGIDWRAPQRTWQPTVAG